MKRLTVEMTPDLGQGDAVARLNTPSSLRQLVLELQDLVRA